SKGMPVLRSKQTGDMYIQVLVETPQKLSRRQRELLSEFERLSSQDTQPEAAGFFGKVKEVLGRSGSALAKCRLTPYRLEGQIGRNSLALGPRSPPQPRNCSSRSLKNRSAFSN